jgi:hypothetical protein
MELIMAVTINIVGSGEPENKKYTIIKQEKDKKSWWKKFKEYFKKANDESTP